ncbi:hypothetical protein LTR62_000485 [Meristemomyces frigidus]|uniref:Uncharacterized protein n=1 Tax=Meristemomyces frigidus TaxID=1508187 RepID=A0AAN7YR02_9PEZI|nr:hypothetical protein LTR62_000485 [Meristemomyces frigidus]
MSQAPTTHREVPLVPAPVSPAHILHIDTSGNRQSLLRAGSKRTFDDIGSQGEDAYAHKHLATEGSLFFRSRTSRSPRNILWRVLEDRKVLEIQGVDLVKEQEHQNADAWLTYRLEFKHEILEKGVQFADVRESDALSCFVLTAGKELITITLKRDLLTRPNVPLELDVSTCVRKYSSSFLAARQPFRFHAVSSLELLVSLTDGGLVRLERQTNESGSQWRETFFSEGGWKGTLTLKGLNPFAGRQTISYGTLELDPSAIVDMAVSPDGKYAWTVSLDHCLRAWSIVTGRVVLKQDLLNKDPENGGRQPYTMSAEQGRLLQIVSAPSQGDDQAVSRMDEDGKYALVVHSPKNHELKMYDVTYETGLDGENIRIQDLQAGTKLIPPVDELMNTNIFSVEHFHLKPGTGWKRTQLWIRARSGQLCRTFTITFDLLDDKRAALDLTKIWASLWSTVDAASSTAEGLKLCADYPGAFTEMDTAITPSERWLRFLFSPDRFTRAELEAALYMYRQSRGLTGAAQSSKVLQNTVAPLQDRLITAITAKILLGRLTDEQPDHERYQQAIQEQWMAYFSVVSHLHDERHKAIGFSFDEATDLPWSVYAEFVAPVRTCSDFELKAANDFLLSEDGEQDSNQLFLDEIYPDDTSVIVTRLLAAAKEFRLAISAEARQKVRETAQREALLSPQQQQSGDGGNRMDMLFDTWHLSKEVGEDEYRDLTASIDIIGGIGNLTNREFTTLLAWLDEDEKAAGKNGPLHLGRFGADMTITVAREKVMRHESILLDVLLMIVFVGAEFEAEDLHPEFDAEELYQDVMKRYKKVSLLLWLLEHERETTHLIAPDVKITETVTILEDVHMSEWMSTLPSSASREATALPQLLTTWTTSWLSSLSLEDDDGSWTETTTHILSRLVAKHEVELATAFLPFIMQASDWCRYVQARLHLLSANYALAASDFRAAAEALAAHGPADESAGLLAVEERSDFGTGKAVYYQHVCARFERLKAWSYVAEFAQLALENTAVVRDFEKSMKAVDRRKGVDSPVNVRMDAAVEESKLLRLNEMRDEVLSRLFGALLLTARFGRAYEALRGMGSRPLREKGLRRLVEGCVADGAVQVLLGLPFAASEGGEGADMVDEVDGVLEEGARRQFVTSGPEVGGARYYQILYAFRTQRGDFRAAAKGLFEYVHWLRDSEMGSSDPEDERLVQGYVLLINTLACCGADDGWLLVDEDREGQKKRRLVRLEDVRREFAAELDRREALLRGRFPLVGRGGGGGEELLA